MDASSRTPATFDREPMGPPSHEPDAGVHPDVPIAWRILDEVDYGVLLVDAAASVRRANASALRECATGVLKIEHGRVQPRGAQHVAAFSRALRASLDGRRSLLTLEAAGVRLALAVVPLTHASPESPATLLVTGRRQACEPLSVELFACAHGLTAAESAVLQGLAAGLRPADIAERAGVSIATVRTQISVIRAKTVTTSICDLLHRIAALPPVTSALRDIPCVRGVPARPGAAPCHVDGLHDGVQRWLREPARSEPGGRYRPERPDARAA